MKLVASIIVFMLLLILGVGLGFDKFGTFVFSAVLALATYERM